MNRRILELALLFQGYGIGFSRKKNGGFFCFSQWLPPLKKGGVGGFAVLLMALWLNNAFIFVRTGHCAARAAGTTAFDFVRVTPDSQPAALGNTGVANADSDFSLLHNPALLSASPFRVRAAGAVLQWFTGIQSNHYVVSVGKSASHRPSWGFGLGWSQYQTGNFGSTDALGRSLGTLNYRGQTWEAGGAYEPFHFFHVGAAYKKMTESFMGSSAGAAKSAAAWDAGVLYDIPRLHMAAGIALQNAGQAVLAGGEREPLPTLWRLGLHGGILNQRFLWSVEGVKEAKESLSVKSGVGFQPLPLLSLRVGYDTVAFQAGRFGLTTGVGFQVRNFSLDYAFVPLGTLGSVQRISLSGRL